MDLTESALWVLVEEAVQRDRNEDEEEVLAQMVRAYLARRGLADTLHAFDTEDRDRDTRASKEGNRHYSPAGRHTTPETLAGAPVGSEAVAAQPSGAATDAVRDVDRRKRAQLLCLQERFDAAAALMPPASLARIRLLCLHAQHLTEISDAVFFLATNVAALVPSCADPVLGHELYTSSLSAVLNPHRVPLVLDVEAIAREVNDELCGAGHPSSLEVLFNWAYWQETAAES